MTTEKTYPERAPRADRSGLTHAVSAYVLWGFFVVYFKAVDHVSAMEILAHRIVWAVPFCALLLVLTKRMGNFTALLRSTKAWRAMSLSAVLISINWLAFVWAVANDRVIEASLGYFINPLINVMFGAAFLGERLRRGQWASVAVAGAGVAWLTWTYGQPPWIAVTLATTFAIYGLLKKKAPLGALEGLGLETLLLFVPALGYLVWVHAMGVGALGAGPWWQTAGLMGAGVATALPLLMFAAAVRRLTLTVVGLLQYIGPTMQFLLGVYVYKEPFTTERFVGFMLIWAALVLFSIEGVWHKRKG